MVAAIEKRGSLNQPRTRRINPLAAFVFRSPFASNAANFGYGRYSYRSSCRNVVTRADFEIIQLQITDFIAAVECTPHPAHPVLCDVKDRSHLRLLLAGSAAGLAPPRSANACHFRKTKNRIVPGARDFSRGVAEPEPSLAAWICPSVKTRRIRLHRPRRSQQKTEVPSMLGWVVTFLVIALIAGILGFGGVAGASIEIAKIIFFIAIVLFLVSAIVGVLRGRRI
jgi:uncharacterized membrane protein YtjA (UPF0391 family)